jgi:hypothetical protein
MRSVFIDQELGKNTIFVIATKEIDKLIVTFISPDGISYNNGSKGYEISDSRIKLTVDQSSGKWLIYFNKKKGFENLYIKASIQVTSELNSKLRGKRSLNALNLPVILQSSISHSEVDPSDPPKIFAVLKRGEFDVD